MNTFLGDNFSCDSWEIVESKLVNLQERSIGSLSDFQHWLKDKSALDAALEEDMAWRYIRMTIDTRDENQAQRYQFFVTEIQPKLAPFDDRLNKKMLSYTSYIGQLSEDTAYHIYFRSVKTALDLYSEANIPLETEINTLSQEYSGIIGKQTIHYKGEELTMPKAAIFLKNPNEAVRKEVYQLIANKRKQDSEKLDELFSKMVTIRHQIALNASCVDYREYKFKTLGRFDYSIKDCLDFHTAIEKKMLPIVKEIAQKQCNELGKDKLKPWDTEVDPKGLPPLKPFENGKELLDGSVRIFDKIDTYFSNCLLEMEKGNYLDLESKTGKAPGGYNYPLYQSGIPFIFMNAAGAQRDVVTMIHEGGHAVHSFLSRDLELTGFKNLPSEVAELASMSMELITMEHWDEFYKNEKDLDRAKKEQLEGVIEVLPWIAIIDSFQHWIYTNPSHTKDERKSEWKKICQRFGTGLIDYSGFEFVQDYSWHKQLHIFEVPFYYIEYGIAQLGALGVWKNYLENSQLAVLHYKKALALGYTKSIPEIYETADLKFDFSEKNMENLAELVRKELMKYN